MLWKKKPEEGGEGKHKTFTLKSPRKMTRSIARRLDLEKNFYRNKMYTILSMSLSIKFLSLMIQES